MNNSDMSYESDSDSLFSLGMRCDKCNRTRCRCIQTQPHQQKRSSLISQIPVTAATFFIGYFLVAIILEVADGLFEQTTGTSYSESFLRWQLTGEYGLLVTLLCMFKNVFDKINLSFMFVAGLMLKDLGIIRGTKTKTQKSGNEIKKNLKNNHPNNQHPLYSEGYHNKKSREKKRRSRRHDDSEYYEAYLKSKRKRHNNKRKMNEASFRQCCRKHLNSKLNRQEKQQYEDNDSSDEGSDFVPDPACRYCPPTRARAQTFKNSHCQKHFNRDPEITDLDQDWMNDEDSPVVVDDSDESTQLTDTNELLNNYNPGLDEKTWDRSKRDIDRYRNDLNLTGRNKRAHPFYHKPYRRK